VAISAPNIELRCALFSPQEDAETQEAVTHVKESAAANARCWGVAITADVADKLRTPLEMNYNSRFHPALRAVSLLGIPQSWRARNAA